MQFIKDGKIVRRIISDRAFIEHPALSVDKQPFAQIGGSFDIRKAIKIGNLFV